MTEVDIAGSSFVVTGGAGFLGVAVCRALRDAGAQHVFVPRSAEFDLTRQTDVDRLFATFRPDVVIHLAAEVGGIGANRRNPGRYFYANMAMGMHLIEAARHLDVRKFVQVGTICAYPKFTDVPFREDDLWSGYPEETNAPYGIAKKALLTMLQAYREQYHLHGIYLLPVNLYGPGDNFDLEHSHVVPAMIRKFTTAVRDGTRSVQLWGSGSATREFLYVDDCATAIVLATRRYDAPEPVNIGTGKEISIRELARLIADMVGFDGEIEWDQSQPDGQPRRCLDTTRAKSSFGFRATTDLQEGLRRTIDYYKQISAGDARP